MENFKEALELGKIGTNVLLIIGIGIIWRQYVTVQAQYQALLERCVVALTEVKNVLSIHEK